MKNRRSGILLHVSSLPSEYGIGDFGSNAYKFVDFLKKSKQTYWQILPLNKTDFINGNSPYSSPSAFAGNKLFISPEMMVKKGLLKKGDIGTAPKFPDDKVDYKRVTEFKDNLLNTAFDKNKVSIKNDKSFLKFCEENSYWLDSYALFTVIKQQNDFRIWTDWPSGLKNREESAIAKVKKYKL